MTGQAVHHLCPPWEKGVESQRSLLNGAFELLVRENGAELIGRIAAIGRDQDAPANPDEETWVNAAVPHVPGMKQVWAADWTLPFASLEALTVALPALAVRREFSGHSSAQLRGLWPCTGPHAFRLSVDWKKQARAGDHGIIVERDATGTRLTSEGPPAFVKGLSAALGMPMEPRMSRVSITPAQLDALVAWATGYAPDQVDYLWCQLQLGG